MRIFNRVIFLFFILIFPANSLSAQGIVSKECNATVRVVGSDTRVNMRKIDGLLVESFLPAAQHETRLSKVCEIVPEEGVEYTENAKLQVMFSHARTEYRPRVYVWSDEQKNWQAHESTMNRAVWRTKADLPIQKMVVAVFADTRDVHSGLASWYRHKRYPMGGATNIYPLGTLLKVTNRENGKEVHVTVTSTWTNTDKKRVIDLVRTAFEKIGNPSVGLIPVTIERISKDDQT